VKVTIDFDYDAALARAVAIKNGGRGLAQPEEIRSWARETLSVMAGRNKAMSYDLVTQ
jgi:hypothetical protein